MTTNCIIHGEWMSKILNSEVMSLEAIQESNFFFFHSHTMCYKTERFVGMFCKCSYDSSWLLPAPAEVNQSTILFLLAIDKI